MARIAGVDLPRDKRVEIGLTYIFGVGLPTSQKVLKEAGVNPDTRVRDVTDDAQRDCAEHQEIDRNWLLPRTKTSPRPAGAWSEYQKQCPYSQRPEAYCQRQTQEIRKGGYLIGSQTNS